jgi:hypothetical protein
MSLGDPVDSTWSLEKPAATKRVHRLAASTCAEGSGDGRGDRTVAEILKFVRFVVFWVTMAPPVLLTAATVTGWTQPALVAGLYVALDVGSTLLLEPVLHAQRLGVSRVKLVLGLAFWAWLWSRRARHRHAADRLPDSCSVATCRSCGTSGY